MNQTEQENREPNYQSIQNIAEDDQNNYVAKIDVGVFLSVSYDAHLILPRKDSVRFARKS